MSSSPPGLLYNDHSIGQVWDTEFIEKIEKSCQTVSETLYRKQCNTVYKQQCNTVNEQVGLIITNKCSIFIYFFYIYVQGWDRNLSVLSDIEFGPP